MAARAHRLAIGGAGVVVQQAARQQFRRILALQVVQPAVRRIAVQPAVVRDQFAGIGEARQHLRDRPGVAGPHHAAGQAQAEGGIGPVVAHREHLQAHAVVPERIAHRHQLERIPEVDPALGQHVRIVGHPPLQQRHHRRRHVQANPAVPGRVEIRRHEQPFHPADVVQVHMGDEQRVRRLPMARLVGAQAFGATVDGQPWPAVALDAGHRRTQRHRRRIANPVQVQRPGSHQQPRFQARS